MSSEGKKDSRNKLNDLTGREWLKLTKSFWLSEKSGDDKFAFKHPAPFLIKDIEKLIRLFTKTKMTVLDPFMGIGTTLIACHNTSRRGIGIELSKAYCRHSKERLKELQIDSKSLRIIQGDALEALKKLKKIDYCVTSPPYHNILKNKGSGLRSEKNGFRIGSRQGIVYYSDDLRDLGNQPTYDEFIQLLSNAMAQVFERLRDKRYCSIIISDFTVDKKEVNVQGDIVRTMNNIGFEFVGTTALLQDNKPLYPFGYPFAYKINHMHQNIINFRKP